MGEERWIRASEVSAYGYCARSWWLRYILELEPQDHGQWAAGTRRHALHGRQVQRTAGLRRAAGVLLIAALLVAAYAVIRLLAGG